MKPNYLLNSPNHFGWISILLHWSMALALISMYFVGDYMVELDYYDTWYHKAPALHKATGVTLASLLIFRFIWNAVQAKPASFESKKLLITAAKLGHWALYLFIVLLAISGFLISTAKGKGIDVFGLFELPALLPDDKDRGELAGKVHALVGTVFISMVALHAVAALIHHFIIKDRTLKRMLWVRK